MAAPVVASSQIAIPVNAASPVLSVTTAQTSYVLILSVYNENHGLSAATVTSVTSSGMTWALRKRSKGTTTGGLELWWASGTGALSSYAVTVNFSGAYDDASICLCVVTGCANPAAPFDTNAGLPAGLSGPTATWTPSFTSISTTSTDDLLLFISGGVSGADGPASGFTQIVRAGNAGGSWSSLSWIEGRSVTVVQTNATITRTGGLTNSFGQTHGEAIFDALSGNLAAGGAQARVAILA